MLTRWLVASGLFVAMGSFFFSAGCSGESDGQPPVTPGDDAGAEDAAVPPKETPDAGGKDKDKRPDPPTVPITYGNCEAFTACGGDVKGYWTVSGGCLSDDFLADFKQGACAGVKESDVVINASGSFDVADTTMDRKLTLQLTAKVEIPQACIDSLITIPGANTCAGVEAGLKSPLLSGVPSFDSVTCTDVTDGCACDVSVKEEDEAEDNYTVSGNTITADVRTFDYCVDGTKAKLQETSGSIPVIVDLTR